MFYEQNCSIGSSIRNSANPSNPHQYELNRKRESERKCHFVSQYQVAVENADGDTPRLQKPLREFSYVN